MMSEGRKGSEMARLISQDSSELSKIGEGIVIFHARLAQMGRISEK